MSETCSYKKILYIYKQDISWGIEQLIIYHASQNPICPINGVNFGHLNLISSEYIIIFNRTNQHYLQVTFIFIFIG